MATAGPAAAASAATIGAGRGDAGAAPTAAPSRTRLRRLQRACHARLLRQRLAASAAAGSGVVGGRFVAPSEATAHAAAVAEEVALRLAMVAPSLAAGVQGAALAPMARRRRNAAVHCFGVPAAAIAGAGSTLLNRFQRGGGAEERNGDVKVHGEHVSERRLQERIEELEAALNAKHSSEGRLQERTEELESSLREKLWAEAAAKAAAAAAAETAAAEAATEKAATEKAAAKQVAAEADVESYRAGPGGLQWQVISTGVWFLDEADIRAAKAADKKARFWAWGLQQGTQPPGSCLFGLVRPRGKWRKP